MAEKLFNQFGPGLLYAQDAIMCFLDGLSRVDGREAENLTKDLAISQKGKRDNLIEEMKEIEYIRSKLLEKFILTLGYTQAHFPKIIPQTLPRLDAPFFILSNVIIPIIEQVSAKTTDSMTKFLDKMNQFLSNNTPAEVWDVPEVSERVIKWMKSALLTPNSDKLSILQFWLNFVKVRAKIEDVLVLASVWYEHDIQLDQLPLIPSLLSDIKSEITPSTFADYIVNPNDPVSITYVGIMSELQNPPQRVSEMPKRKCAAHKGFLYVIDADPKIGFAKLGTGKCGTILGQTVLTSFEFVNRVPLSMAFCGDYLLIRFEDSPPTSITIIDPSTLKVVGDVQNTENIPAGPFAAFNDTLYVVYQRTMNSYHFDGKSLEFLKSQEIHSSSSDSEFLPADNVKLTTLLTDGIFMNAILTSSSATQSKYSCCTINNATVINVPSSAEPKLIPFVAFDSVAKSLIKAPSWQSAQIYNYSDRYDFEILYGKMSEIQSDNACLNLLNTIVPSSISKISADSINYNRHYVLANTEPAYELLQKCFSDEKYNVFLEPVIILLAIHLQEVDEQPKMSLPLLVDIASHKSISSETKVVFFKSLLKHSNLEVFNSPEQCASILEKMETKEITQIFGNGFNDSFSFCLSFLVKPFDKVLEYAANNSLTEYPFISNLIFTTLRGYYVKHLFEPGHFLPILSVIPKCDPSVVTTLIPPLIPIIQKISQMMLSDQYTKIILDVISLLIEHTHISDLRTFAEKHAELREKPQFITTTVTDETTHPYDNDMRLTRHYEFPGAVEINIKFDSNTTTETNCDYLQIFEDKEMKKSITPKLSGKYAKWGEYTVNTQRLTFYFYSDGSVNDWGYRAIMTIKYRSSRSFLSPPAFFDMAYSIVLILSNISKSLFNDVKYPTFDIPSDILAKTLSIDEKKALREKVKSDVDLTVFDAPTTLPSFYSVLSHLVSTKTFDKSLLPNIMAPPEFMITKTPNPKELYRKIASFLLTNDFSELPESQFAFLAENIKGTTESYAAADNLINRAFHFLDAKHPEHLIQASTYIQRAIKISGDYLLKKDTKVMNEYLSVLAHSYMPLNTTLHTSIIEKSNQLFETLLPTMNGIATLFETICDSLSQAEVNSPTTTVPFISFALSAAFMLPNKKDLSGLITKLVLTSLKFLMPDAMTLINKLTEKFVIKTTIKESPIIVSLLTSIGENFNVEYPKPTSIYSMNISPSFAIARAAILRKILHPDSLSDLAEIIEKQDHAALGALLVLSQRYVPPYLSQKVKLLSNKKVVTLVGMDYQSYHFETDKGNRFSIRALNYQHFTYMAPPFKPILPPVIPAVSEQLVMAVQKCASKDDFIFQLFGKCALAELSVNSIPGFEKDKQTQQIWPALPPHVSFDEPAKERQSSDLFSINEDLTNSKVPLQPLKVAQDTISYFKHDSDQKLYRLNRATTIITFKPQQKMTVGFGAENRISGTEIAPIKFDKNIITFDFSNLKVEYSSPDVTIGLYGPYKQVYIYANGLFAFTQVFLGAIQNPQPFFLSQAEPELVTPQDFPSFLFYAKSNRVFTHVYSCHKLYSIVDQMNATTPVSDMHFLPPISSNISGYIYLEITGACDDMSFSLLNETVRAYRLYYHLQKTKNTSTNTYGFCVSFNKPRPFAFVTLNGEFIAASAHQINLTERVSLYVSSGSSSSESGLSVSVNTGSKPFKFDVAKAISTFDITKFDPQSPSVDNRNIPIGLSSLVSIPKQPIDFNLPVKKPLRRTQFERPIFVPSKNLVSFMVPPPEKVSINSHITVDVYGDCLRTETVRIDEIVSLTESLPEKKVQSITALQRIQTSMPQFISPFLFCKSSELDAQFRHLLTKARREQFFNQIDLTAQSAVALNAISRFTNDQFDSFNNIEDFIIRAAISFATPKILNGYYDETFGKLMMTIFNNRPQLFESLAEKAIGYLLHESENASDTIIPNLAKAQIEIGRNSADCIFFRILPHSFISNSNPPINGIDMGGRKMVLNLNSQHLFEGSEFALQNIKEIDILYARVMPIYFDKSPLTFALQMVNFMIKQGSTWNILHNKILLPLFESCQNGSDILFPSTYSRWFSKAYINSTISQPLMAEYSKKIDIYGLSRLSDELCNSLLLFSLYCYANSAGTNMELVREKTITFLDSMLSCQQNYSLNGNSLLEQSTSYKFTNCYGTKQDSFVFISHPSFVQVPAVFGSVLNRLSQALISPFGNKLQFLGKIGQLDLPVLTMSSYIYLVESEYETHDHLDLMNLSIYDKERIYSGPQLGGIYINYQNMPFDVHVMSANDTITVDRSMRVYSRPSPSTKVDKVESNEFSVKLNILKEFEGTADIYTFKGFMPQNDTFVRILKIYNELKASLTSEIDSYLVSIAQFMLQRNIDMALVIDDKSLQRLYPSISPAALRYRISCHLAALKDGIGLSCSCTFKNSSPSTCYTSNQHRLGAIVPVVSGAFSTSNNNNMNDFYSLEKRDAKFGSVEGITLQKFLFGETHETAFFAKFKQWTEIAPMRIFDNFPVKMTSVTDEEYVITKYLKTLGTSLFNSNDQGMRMPLPTATDPNSLLAFQGFGFFLGLRFISGRSPGYPISRAVIRAAFGGKITQDDLSDTQYKVSDLKQFETQLEAIRIGVELAIPGISQMVPTASFPRVFQLAPKLPASISLSQSPPEFKDFVFSPLIRQKLLFSAELHKVPIDEVEQRQALIESIIKDTIAQLPK